MRNGHIEKPVFNYSKLRGRITEKCGTQKRFCSIMQMSQSTLSNKLACVTYFSQTEIYYICDVLGIEPEHVAQYFFTQKT